MARRRRYNHKRRRGSLSFLYKLLAFVLICTAISLALTLFFRIRSIEVSGNDRYTRQEIIDAAGVSEGDNMFLMNKYSAAERIRKALPYIETVQFRRSLPDGLSIIVTECADPAAIVQDGKAYLLCDTGNIVDEVTPAAAKQRMQIKGLTLTDAAVSGTVRRAAAPGGRLRLQAGLSDGRGGEAGGQRKGRYQYDAGGEGTVHSGVMPRVPHRIGDAAQGLHAPGTKLFR